ncbi:TetR/AcrR family transcriptional regulator [Microbacterium sp.]|uniref:TetR/AcrR family transcriptional regulator n=1 Tax=Microbacterium sp. TaxID=51671 RepID=UPI0039E58550
MTAAGRPRKPSIDEAILDAFAELVVERGYTRVTVDDVVDRAGSNKPAFYRRFRDLADVVPRLLAERHGLDADIDTGSLVEDLLEVQRRQLALFTDPAVSRGLIGWAAYVSAHPERAEPFVSSYLAPRRAFTHVILARAVARGEIREGADADWIADLLTGPLLMRVTLPGLPPITEELVVLTVTAALDALGLARTA